MKESIEKQSIGKFDINNKTKIKPRVFDSSL